jgi:hypothetical protein
MSTEDTQQLTFDVWQNVCFHIDGLAVATTVFALEKVGIFESLRAATTPLDIAELATSLDLRDGYLNLAFRLFELQGYVERTGDVAAGQARVRLTPDGLAWLPHVSAYRDAPARVDRARALLAGRDIAAPAFEPALSTLPHRVRRNIEGAEVAAVMTAFTHDATFDRLADAGESGLDLRDLSSAAAGEALSQQGWATIGGGAIRLTDAGRIAVRMAPQYFYPASYLATLASVPGLLQGRSDVPAPRAADGTEAHVDRELDIEFSGLVFARTCRTPLFELALPLFDRLPLDVQPTAIVDCGAGDGTLLCELYDAIVQRTARGRSLATHPLVMVGVEYNPVAERVLAERLGSANIPNLVFAGDIGDPENIARRLLMEGYGADDLLHVSKSVFHNRTYAGTPAGPDATSTGAFVAPGGAHLTAAHIEADLESLFARWRECLGRHGLLIVEAHIAEAELTTARLGRSVTSWLEASHGYSHQYLVESGVHRRAAQRAGLRARGAREFGIEIAGAPMMTIDHYGI